MAVVISEGLHDGLSEGVLVVGDRKGNCGGTSNEDVGVGGPGVPGTDGKRGMMVGGLSGKGVSGVLEDTWLMPFSLIFTSV